MRNAAQKKHKISILYVDDDVTILVLMKNIFDFFDYNVTLTKSPNQVLQIFQENPDQFDIVITDYDMPQMNGLILASKIKNIRPSIPIILCSGSDLLKNHLIEGMNVNYFIIKPFDINQLKMAIQSLLDNRI